MITATATGANGEEIILLGITRENVTRLMKGQPIRVTAETHPGFPVNRVIMICFGETERTLTEQLKSSISDETKVVMVPRPTSQPVRVE